MRVITLHQPWASLAVTERTNVKEYVPLKGWETRSWRPQLAYQHMLNQEGLLIHVSSKYLPQHEALLNSEPYRFYRDIWKHTRQGHIIGWVRIGRIISARQWIEEFKPKILVGNDPLAWTPINENYHFGDFGKGRWAWELLEPIMFKTPIKAKGQQRFWNYNESINLYKQ